MNRLINTLLILLVFFFTSSQRTFAQINPNEERNFPEGIYLGFNFGKSITQNSYLFILQNSRYTDIRFSKIKFKDDSFKPPFYYDVSLGFYIPKTILGFEVEFIHSKVYAQTDKVVNANGYWNGKYINGEVILGDYIQSFSISHGLNFLFLNILFQHNLLENDNNDLQQKSKLRLINKLGFGFLINHIENKIQDDEISKYETDGPALQFSSGIKYNLYKIIFLNGEYKFTVARISGASFVDGSVSTTLLSHHFVFGFSLEF